MVLQQVRLYTKDFEELNSIKFTENEKVQVKMVTSQKTNGNIFME